MHGRVAYYQTPSPIRRGEKALLTGIVVGTTVSTNGKPPLTTVNCQLKTENALQLILQCVHGLSLCRCWRYAVGMFMLPGTTLLQSLVTRQSMRCAIIAAMLLAGSACQQRSSRPSTPGVISSDPTGARDVNEASGSRSDRRPQWPFWPVAMRVHPLTRLTTAVQGDASIIECRLEFSDSEGQTTKAVGQLTLQVYPDSVVAAGRGALETWNQDLRDLELNRRQYDDITRTYLFRLEVTQPLPAGCEIRAFFLSADGRRLHAELRLRP